MSYIKDIEKSKTEIIRIEVTEYKGEKYLNIRIWFKDKNTEEFKPTQKGVTIRGNQYEDFKTAIHEAANFLLP